MTAPFLLDEMSEESTCLVGPFHICRAAAWNKDPAFGVIGIHYSMPKHTEAARIGGVTLQIIRDWVMRFNARGATGLLDGKSPGQPSRLTDV
jgi:hypothetical protein